MMKINVRENNRFSTKYNTKSTWYYHYCKQKIKILCDNRWSIKFRPNKKVLSVREENITANIMCRLKLYSLLFTRKVKHVENLQNTLRKSKYYFPILKIDYLYFIVNCWYNNWDGQMALYIEIKLTMTTKITKTIYQFCS